VGGIRVSTASGRRRLGRGFASATADKARRHRLQRRRARAVPHPGPRVLPQNGQSVRRGLFRSIPGLSEVFPPGPTAVRFKRAVAASRHRRLRPLRRRPHEPAALHRLPVAQKISPGGSPYYDNLVLLDTVNGSPGRLTIAGGAVHLAAIRPWPTSAPASPPSPASNRRLDGGARCAPGASRDAAERHPDREGHTYVCGRRQPRPGRRRLGLIPRHVDLNLAGRLADSTLGASAAAFDFTSIPATYAHLLLVVSRAAMPPQPTIGVQLRFTTTAAASTRTEQRARHAHSLWAGSAEGANSMAPRSPPR